MRYIFLVVLFGFSFLFSACSHKEIEKDVILNELANKIKSQSVQIDLSSKFPDKSVKFFELKKIILVGEMHGTEQTPELFGIFVSAVANPKNKTAVLLELPQSSQKSIDSFIETNNDIFLKNDSFFNRKYQDGRSSKAMVSLLNKVGKLKNLKIICMDPMVGIKTMSAQDRDTGMAKIINSNVDKFDQIFVLSGNVHSSTVFGVPWDDKFRPMGYEVKEMNKTLKESDIYNILVRYDQFSAWTCETAEASSCMMRTSKMYSGEYSKAVDWNYYFYPEEKLAENHLGTFFIRKTDASMPYLNK